MIRIRVLSDLHIDHRWNRWDDVQSVDCDVTVVIGDVTNAMTRGLEWVAQNLGGGRPLIYVPGNHCFYRADPEESQTYYQDQMSRGREMCERLGITMIQNETAEIDGIRFIGATMWTDFSILPRGMSIKDAMSQSQKGWHEGGWRNYERDYHNDYREIRYGGPGSKRRLTPSQTLAMHRESKAFFERTLATPFDGETVCITHMAPSRRSLMPGNHVHDWLYSCSLDHLMEGENAPALWLHGHIHANRDYTIGNTRIVANPRGYALGPGKRENPDFDPMLVLELEPRPAATATCGM